MSKGCLSWLSLIVACGLAWIGCKKEVDGPTPELAAPSPDAATAVADPPIVCRDQLTTEVQVHGENFSPVPIGVSQKPQMALPDVTLARGHELDGSDVSSPEEILYSGNRDISHTNARLLSWQSQQQMTFVVNQRIELPDGSRGMLGEGVYDVTVQNPNENQARSEGALAVIDKPTFTSTAPGLVCLQQGAATITLEGERLLRNGSDQVVLEVAGVSESFDVTLDQDSCTTIEHDGIDAEFCSEASVELGQDSVEPGFPRLFLQNPETAACRSEEERRLRVVPEPTISSVSPTTVCTAQETIPLTINGSDFLRIDGNEPDVEVDGNSYDVLTMGGCSDLPTQGHTVERCGSIEIDVDLSAFAAGSYDVTVTNPAPGGCSGTATGIFEVQPQPQISAVSPANVCENTATTLTITGTNLVEGSIVLADTTPADTVTFVDDTEMQATWDDGLGAGTYDITVRHAAGACEATAANALAVDPAPIVFFVDPPVIYNGISIEATIFVSGLSTNASSVELVDSGGNATSLTFSSPTRPGRIQATVPAGLAAGDYTVRVGNPAGCAGILDGAVTVTDETTLALESIDPAFASPSEPTAVTMRTTDPLPADTVGFVSTPRAYLSPVSGGGIAEPLRAVEFVDSTTVTAVIPENLTPGEYDLIVVNPTGEVGLLPNNDTVTVTSAEPPLITSVVPSSLDNDQDVDNVEILGSHFDTGGVSVELICRDPDDVITSGLATNVNVVDSETVTVTMPTNGLTEGSICLVELTNNSDGALFSYSAVSIKNPAQNLNAWSDGTSLSTARRALGLVAARPTATSRFLYAIGGDDGDPANAFSSVESTSVDVFGDLGASWDTQVNSLPAPRTNMGFARIGNFVYVTGGDGGSGATNTVYRAEVLDPLAAPDIIDLDATLGDGSEGLGGGTWFYRVAATFPDSDANNPGGESLPGEVFTVRLPDRPEGIIVDLMWEQIPGADGYRIYRTAQADDPVDSVELLTVIDDGSTTTYPDTGTATTAEAPLPRGSLGVWDPVASMNTAREGHATVAVQLPGDESTWFLYAFGGRDDTTPAPQLLDSYEWAEVSIGSGTQTVSSWSTGSKTIGTAKADLAAWVVTNSDTSLVGTNEVFVYLGTGFTGANTVTGDVVSGSLTDAATDGDLVSSDATDLDPESGTGNSRGATCFGDASGFIFLFGGESGTGTLTAQDWSTEIVGDPPGPDNNWNAPGGGSLSTRRSYCATAQESAFFFTAGGRTATETATTSVEQTVQ